MIHTLYTYFLTRRHIKNPSILQKKLRWQLFKFLKRSLSHYYQTLSIADLKTVEDSPLIVSLTSIPRRIHLVPLVIKSILHQTFKPREIVLWLGTDKFPNGEADLPVDLLALKTCGLVICFCKDLKPHTKYYYAFKEYKKDLIVTVDDDLFYPRDLLKRLMMTYKLHPESVIAHRVRLIGIKDAVILPYREWIINPVGVTGPSKMLLATGVGGVLYRPELFSDDLLNKDDIEKLCLNADDIWLKVHELRDGIPVVFTNYYFRPFIEMESSQEEGLHIQNVFKNGNDVQISRTFSYFRITNTFFD